MMVVDPIENGIVLDHITAGNAMKLYTILGLDKLDCSVAIIKNADSVKMGRKDIIKIGEVLDMDFGILAIVDPGVTVNVIRDSKNTKLKGIAPPETVTNFFRCKNPRCITGTEQELKHVFRLTDREKKEYRCIYCETKA